MNGNGSCVAWRFCAVILMAGCTSSAAEPADSGARGDGASLDESAVDTSARPMVWCGEEGGTPCCGDDLVVLGSTFPRFVADASVARITGTIGLGVVTAVEPAAADAPADGPCVAGRVTGMTCEYRSTWMLTMASGETTRVDSSLQVADASWLVGQSVRLIGRPGALIHFTMQLQDESGRLLVWQMDGVGPWDTDTFSAIESETPLPFTLGVHRAPEDTICRYRTEPCWTQDVQALDVTVDGATHKLGPGESFEFVADGLRYRVTDHLIVSRTGAGCYDLLWDGWSLDVVAVGPAT